MDTFDGATYLANRDEERLARQLARVRGAVADGNWRSLAEISRLTSAPQASVSARLRDLRKPRYGSLTVERRYLRNGLWLYRVTGPA